MKNAYRPFYSAVLAVMVLVLAGCAGPVPTSVQPAVHLPTPTVHALFQKNSPTAGASIPSTALLDGKTSAAAQSLPPDTVEPAPQEVLRSIPIYNDSPASNWEIFSPGGMQVDASSTESVHQGRRSIEVTPLEPESKLYIALMPGGEEIYQRDRVAGISLWLYSGEEELDLYDLALTAIGSNSLPYYQVDDRSGENQKPYEETFLYWLGFNDNIPAHTWVEVEIWLDRMLFDPQYQYVTGLYITNRFNFKRTFFIDDISLILIDSQAEAQEDITLQQLPPLLQDGAPEKQ